MVSSAGSGEKLGSVGAAGELEPARDLDRQVPVTKRNADVRVLRVGPSPGDHGAVSISATHDLTPETQNGRPGRVILLNGTSSSGKSSIAKELLATLNGVWFHRRTLLVARTRTS
jgi:hypothetical protein